LTDDELEATEPAYELVEHARQKAMPTWARVLLVVGLLYLFLVGVRLLEGGINVLGGGTSEGLFEGVANPIAALCVGVLATVLVQSSSVTTATIVGLVASGALSIETAVPMIMGANIGTTVTNTIVSLGHVRRSDEFRRAFTAATMHDFFNVMVVAVLLPLELTTHFLTKGASELAERIVGGVAGGSFDSPIKGAVGWGAGRIEALLESVAGNETVLGVALILVGIGFIFVTLAFITRNMKVLVAARIEQSLNAVLAKSGLIAMFAGLIITISVQSSSITTSILIPLVAGGLLAVRNAYPITLGANVGTTITALLAAFGAGTVDGLTIALVHTFFNIIGIMLVYPIPAIRYVPVRLATGLSAVATKRRWLVFVYVGGVFIALPLLGIVLLT
jgi:sodium-dependent phosphate cotransporter